MPKRIMPLTDIQVNKTKPKSKQFTLFDGAGLFLLITPSGGKLWRFKYRYEGKEKVIAFGSYPDISLAEARTRRQDARNKVANGVDPAEVRKAIKEEETLACLTFEKVAREWFGKNEPIWSDSHRKTVMGRLELHVFPDIGNRPINDIKRVEIVTLLKKVDDRGIAETADRIKNYTERIFRYALNNELIAVNLATSFKDIISKRTETHHAAITKPKEVSKLLRLIDEYSGTFTVKSALALAPMFFVRPGELSRARWEEFDLDEAEWNIPGPKMKMKEPHLVPLSKQAIAILKELHKLNGNSKFVFPSQRGFSRPMSNVALLGALRTMGYGKDEMCTHGFRAMARTILDEVLHVRVDLIEHQLAHEVKDPNGRAYNRTSFLPQRREMMQQWADYLDGLKSGGNQPVNQKNAGNS